MESEEQDSEHAAENLYRQEFELLTGMFEDHFSPQVIAGVLEDCYGDVNLAVDTLTKIEDSGTEANVVLDTPTNTNIECNSEVTECTNSNMNSTNGNTGLKALPYTAAAVISPVQTTALVQTQPSKSNTVKHPRSKNVMPKVDYWSDEIKNIIRWHNEGSRVMVVMRGPPGSGKTYLARVIVESTIGTCDSNNYENHIFSADDFMQKNGVYHYSAFRLSEVHANNQASVRKATHEGRSPIIVDNTNMTTWEMYPYVNHAVKNGYIVEVVEPNNPWSQIPSQLAKRNIHGVPKDKIQTMIQKYEGSHTGNSLIKYFKLSYSKGMEPPVIRNVPAFYKQSPLEVKLIEKMESVSESIVNHINQQHNISNDSAFATPGPLELLKENPKIQETPSTLIVNDISSINQSIDHDNEIQKKMTEVEKNLDEMLKIEVEWENGDEWDTPIQNQKPNAAVASSSVPKPRRFQNQSEIFIEPSMINDDWTKNLLFMQSSPSDAASPIKKNETSHIQIQTEAIGTLVEIGDLTNDRNKNISTTPEDINENNKSAREDITLNRQVSNSSKSAQEALFSGFHVCEQGDKYFTNFRKMFKNIPRPVLREIYDNCDGNANWACSIVLDAIKNNTIQTVTTDLSDSEEDVHVECQCTERDIEVPGIITETATPISCENKTPIATPTSKKKPKKEKSVTEGSSVVLQNIKKSIKISENHYSQYCLNLKKSRYDNQSPNDQAASYVNVNSIESNNVNSPQNGGLGKRSIAVQSNSSPPPDSSSEVTLPDSSQNVLYRDIPTTSSFGNTQNALSTTSGTVNLESTDADDEFEEEEDDYDTIGSDDEKSEIGKDRNVTVNIGMEFVRKLDELYGRHDFEYPPGIQPVLSIPTKILHELNAFWIESISHQLDSNHTQTEEMIKQDEEFARQVEFELQLEAIEETSAEEENARALPETTKPQGPSVPNFREIMDTELALTLYEKEVKEEWKNKEPQDMAAQMTRKKLYEIFPDVARETLSEMLIAHENSFNTTVETLMVSTGQGHYLDQANGVNKFVMEKERENKEIMLLAEQNAGLDEEEYPYLLKPGKEQTELSMDTVNHMRQKAKDHKIARDKFFQKAKWYYERKKLAEASYYSRIASMHTARYDIANSYAAAVLVQYHANFHPGGNVIDLHFLRVAEAETTLDLHIDARLRLLRLSPDSRPIVLHIITGRGKHSPGRPRVKPAIMRRLTARGLNFRQQNPGLLEARLKPTHLLTVELLNP